MTTMTRRLGVAAVGALVLGASVVPGAAADAGHAPDAPTGLTVNSREHPRGVEGDPFFAWLPQDEDLDEVQTAYRLEVREAGTEAVVWDSGKVASSEQAFVGYDGPDLAPGTSFEWSVRTWDRTDQVSPPATGAFDTGLPDEAWAPAQWIQRAPGGPGPMALADGRVRVTGGDVTLAGTGRDWADYTYEVTVRPTTRGAGVVFRSPDRRNGYMWQLSAGTGLSPHVLVDGAFTRLATVPLTVVNGQDYRLRIELAGPLIRTFVDGTLVDERTDTRFAAGTVGFREASNEVGQFDDVRVTAPDGAVLLADDFSGTLAAWENVTTTRQLDEWTLARTDVELASADVVRARAYVAGSHTYELWIDGERADRGQSFAYPGEHYYQTTDVTELLDGRGRVAVGAVLHWYGSGQGRPAVQPGLLVRIEVEYADGSEQVIVSDGTWKVTEGPYLQAGRRNGEGELIEHLDATRVIEGWQSTGFDDSAWGDAVVLGTHPTAPFTALTGQLTRMEETEVPAVELLVADDGTVVADFGVVIPARPVVRFDEGVAGRVVTMRASYELAEDGRVSTSGVATQGTTMTFPYTQVDGPQEFRAFTHLGFRYLELPGVGEDIALEDVSAVVVHTELPEREHATFASSDETLDEVWDLMVRSARYSVQEAFVDTPTREKGQFLGDFVAISYATMGVFGERAHTQQAIAEFLNSADRFWNSGEDLGRYNAVYPNGDGKRDIPDYALMFVDGVWRYYSETGDRALLARAYPYMRQTADYVLRHIPAEGPTAGLVTRLTGGSGSYQYGIVDWPEHGRFGYDMAAAARTTINAQGVDVLRDVARMAQALGEAEDATSYGAAGDALAVTMNERLRRADGVYIDGLYADGTPSTHAGQHSTSYAIAHGVAPEEDYPALAAHLAGMGMRQGPMTAHWLLQALSDAGDDDAVLERLTDAQDYGWANILAQGGTFTWESWELSGSANSASHGWGAQAVVDVQQTLLGVRTAAPGAAVVDIVPPDSALEHAAGTVPTQRGPVGVDWERHERGMRLTVDVPVNVTARVAIPVTGDETYAPVDRPGVRPLGVEDGRALFEVGSGVTTFDVVDDPVLTVEADTRCVAGKVVQTVRVGNVSDEPVEVVVAGDYGTRTLTVAPERAAAVAFSTRLGAVPAGEVTARTASGDAAVGAAHAARACR
ncbi:family 78 glycoside hydrolase catalytic domain [Georgenia faecalis]|uniref:family 78 glycoside hydrolase catalytic domain n=1 Tax=Georgenia faecalis TaxID=2483799 RepID=UPI0019CFF881|nr:family 78 glycoside hydrolase catalytic domain [Georgenia faecalis]